MNRLTKALLVGIVGVLLALAGGYLRLHAKALSTHSSGATPMTDANGRQIGSVTYSQEDASQTAALTDISLGLLYVGGALTVVGVTAWVLSPARKLEHDSPAG